MQQEFEALRIDRRGAAATVRMMWPDGRIERFRQFHREFPIALQLVHGEFVVTLRLAWTRPRTLRRSTISWCRSAAFSASSRLFV
jgi:hypothetical protein